MQFFAYSENDLTKLYKNTIQLAQIEIIEKINLYNWSNEDFIVVVFHAGLGQDLGAPLFDPTVVPIDRADPGTNHRFGLEEQHPTQFLRSQQHIYMGSEEGC
mgnify:CR=1 FL=1